MKALMIIAFLLSGLALSAQDTSQVSVGPGMRWKHIDAISDTASLTLMKEAEFQFELAASAYEARFENPGLMKDDGVQALSRAYELYDRIILIEGNKEKALPREFYQLALEVSRMYRQVDRLMHFYGERDRCYMGNLTHHTSECTCGHCPRGRDLILMMRLSN